MKPLFLATKFGKLFTNKGDIHNEQRV